MKKKPYEIFQVFVCHSWLIIIIVYFSTGLSGQNGRDSVQLEFEKMSLKNIYDLPVSYEDSEEILHYGELARALEGYSAIDNKIFSVADFLSMVAERFPENDPVVNVRNLEFKLNEYESYISLRGRLYLKSTFFYTDDMQIEKIVINLP